MSKASSVAASNLPPRSKPRYHPFYCEENLWWWTHGLSNKERTAAHVLVISNPARRAAIGLQKLGHAPVGLMVWDYHVIGFQHLGTEAWVIDFDTNAAEHRIEASWWLATQSQIIANVTPEFEPLFRPIQADTYYEAFSSTRSHMLNEEGDFIHPAPAWPCIQSTQPTSPRLRASWLRMPLRVGIASETSRRASRALRVKDPRP